MAALVVQSRFAGLKIEDDDYPHPSSSDIQKSKKNKTNTAKKIEPPKKTKNNGNNNISKPQGAAKKKKSKQGQVSENQWELWKQKDEELVDGNFECELQQAILLSKLDFEEKKDVYKQLKKEADIEKKTVEQNTRNTNKKQKKRNVMSLEQFNDMVNNGEENKATNDEETTTSTDNIKVPDKDTEFFERVKDETKHELLKDKINDRVRNSQTPTDAFINRVQFACILEKKNEEIATLQEEVSSLKQELRTVKSRNKKLCGILGQGEMKDKAEVLVEVERLRSVQAELTAEIASLHSDLEKERSKNTDPRAKDKKTKKKNIRFDTSSEVVTTKDTHSGLN